MGLVCMLYCTSLLAIVGAGQQASASPRRLQLYNSSDQKSICELNFMDSILNVKLNKKRYAAVAVGPRLERGFFGVVWRIEEAKIPTNTPFVPSGMDWVGGMSFPRIGV